MIRHAVTRASGLGALLAALLLGGCQEPQDAPLAAPARPVKLFRVDSELDEDIRRFPASIAAHRRADLSFRVSGTLAELPVREGDVVREGDLVARLDPTDFRIALEDRQARFDNAQRNFERARELVDSGNISRLDFDRMEAEFRSARAALAQARNNLDYAELRAPFTGRVARRRVENFEEVLAKQTVAELQDTDQLDVIIALPESIVRSVKGASREMVSTTNVTESPASAVLAMVSFDDHPDIAYALQLSEVATRADADTQTFRVTFTMAQPEEFTVLPGMTAQVELDFTGLIEEGGGTWIPARAVQADANLAARVWVLDADSMTVHTRPVDVGRLSGRMIEVRSGLEGGEEIVAAGAAYLTEGMRVTRMESGEQAEPRDGDGPQP
jgi:RND family efflux transporter MFP subunit